MASPTADTSAVVVPLYRWWRIRLYPLVVPAVLVVLTWVNASLHPGVLFRPLVVTLLISVGITIVATWLARDADKGALLGAAILIGLIATDVPLLVTVFVIAAAIAVAVVASRGRPWRLGPLTTRVLGGVSVVLVLALGLKLVGDGVVADSWSELTTTERPTGATPVAGETPDLIVILLDAYPGERATRIAGADLSAFPAALEARGFVVQADSHSNYMFTGLTLGSMFAMQHIGENPSLKGPWDAGYRDARRLRLAINGGRALDTFAGAGYDTISIASGFDHSEVRRVDRFVTPPQVGEFEVALLRLFAVGDVIDRVLPDLVSSQQRARILDTLDLTARIAAEAHEGPRFLYAHVPAPHAPWVFGPNGEPREARLADFYSDDPGSLKLDQQVAFDLAADQAVFTGERVVELVDRIVASAVRPTTIVVLSDHGPGIADASGPAVEGNMEERFSNFLAIRTHDGQDLLATRLTPVNLFQRWFEAYLDIRSEPSDDGTYIGQEAYLNPTRVHPVAEWEP